MSVSKTPIWHYLTNGVIAAGTTYIALPITKGTIGCHIAWTDATSNAALTVELTSFPEDDVALGAAASYFWKDSGISLTGPAASAAGSVEVNAENVRQSRARLKVVAAANTSLIIYNGDQPL